MSTIDQNEVARFAAMADEWWDPTGKFAPLHRMNPGRIAWVRDSLCAKFGRDPKSLRPFEGLRIVDIGCGGGLLSEPLARLGATVLGVDAAERNVAVARLHAERSELAITYRSGTAEDLAAEGQTFDAVVAMEIVEHVADLDLFIATCARLLTPGGTALFSTVNRTAKSYALAIVAAEYILRWLPAGTHDWKRFVKPSELAAALRRHRCVVRDIAGLVFDPMTGGFVVDRRNVAVNYALAADKM